MDLWRSFIEERAGTDLAKLESVMRDQKAFARLTRLILRDLAQGEEGENASDDEAESETSESQDQGSDQQESQNQSETGEAEFSEERGEEGEDAEAEMGGELSEELAEGEHAEQAASPTGPSRPSPRPKAGATRSTPPSMTRRFPPPIFATRRS